MIDYSNSALQALVGKRILAIDESPTADTIPSADACIVLEGDCSILVLSCGCCGGASLCVKKEETDGEPVGE